MSFWVAGAVVGSAVIGGVVQSSAASKAAKQQGESADDAIAAQERALAQTREDLRPFREAGESALPGLTSLTNDPEAQRDFITKNPFFDALADDAQRRIFQNKAARGKVGSGGTAEALQNSLLLLGPQLVQQGIENRFNLATMGQNSAARVGTATMNAGRTISDLNTQQGNAQAAGTVGQANAITGALEGITSGIGMLNTGGGTTSPGIGGGGGTGQMFGNTQVAPTISDRRMKTDIEHVGELHNGLKVYTFKYKGEDKVNIGVMAQEVEKVVPEAVHEFDGIKHVDYGAIQWH